MRVTCSVCGGKYTITCRNRDKLRYPRMHNKFTGKYMDSVCPGSLLVCVEDSKYKKGK